MRILILVVVLLGFAVPAHAQDPPPVPPSLEALRAFIQQSRAEDAAQQTQTATGIHVKLDLGASDRVELKAALARLELALKDHDQRPAWFVKVFENRAVQLILVGVGTLITEKLVTK